MRRQAPVALINSGRKVEGGAGKKLFAQNAPTSCHADKQALQSKAQKSTSNLPHGQMQKNHCQQSTAVAPSC